MRSELMNRGVSEISDAGSKLSSTKLTAACSFRISVIVLTLLLTELSAHAQETVLYNFCSQTGCTDGNSPQSSLTTDGAGNLYGTTAYGGATNNGTVFELSPNGVGGYNESVLYSFCPRTGCADGSGPIYSNVTFDSAGNLYGTTVFGGAKGDGTVFQLSPKPGTGCPSGSNTGNGWCETVLHSFGLDGDAIFPTNGLVLDKQGNLYGNALTHAHYHGVNCLGLVYELSFSTIDGWTYKGIYSPRHEIYDSLNNDGLAIDSSGNLYGAAGASIFELSPNGMGGWTPTIIHHFKVPPVGVPVPDSAGNLYGTTYFGGTGSCSGGCGTVWKLSPHGGKWTASILYSFQGGSTDGSTPSAGIVLDSGGNIYGTTSFGGANGLGTVFELAFNGASYQEEILWNFNGTDGDDPVDSLILVGGNLYGTTQYGGSAYSSMNFASGVVFEVNP